jgi:hypothetical protein
LLNREGKVDSLDVDEQTIALVKFALAELLRRVVSGRAVTRKLKFEVQREDPV